MRIAVLFALVATVSFIGGISIGASAHGNTVASAFSGLDATPDANVKLDDFWRVWNTLEGKHVGIRATSTEPTDKEKIWGAIEGLAESYGDPYTVFLRPQEAKTFREDISGSFSGVGMEIGIRNNALTVIAPLKDTPAERAGIKTGDVIVAIDGVPTEGVSVDVAVQRIRGEKGTAVVLKMYRDGKTEDISVVRDTVRVPTIEWTYDRENDVFVISMYTFAAQADRAFTRALADFRGTGSKNLLIDLRGNPGGYLDSAVLLASHFIPKGEVVVIEDYGGNEERVLHRSKGTGGVPQGTRTAILINQGSASASEILAGALQDYQIAKIIGEQSFGKGSVQELIDVAGGSLKITIARWLTPLEQSISDGGLTPDITVEKTKEDVEKGIDTQKERAIQYLKTGK